MAFNTGDNATGAQAITAELNLSKDGTTWDIICMSGLTEALNLIVSSQANLCSGGNTSNTVTGMDRTWSGEVVVRYGAVSWDMAKSSFVADLNNFNNIPFRITDIFTEEITEAKVAITSWEKTQESTEFIKLSLEFKIFDGIPTVTPVPVTP